ncbi:MAG TPA: histidine kinase [Chitinophagaceae bacterium]|nr:histidine kinase [Chitinophagaceae bacterium]
MFSSRQSLILQVVAWLLFVALLYLYLNLQHAGAGAGYLVSVVLSYLLPFAGIIYGYVFIYNRLHYRKHRITLISLSVAAWFILVTAIRLHLDHMVIPQFFNDHDPAHWSFTLTGCFFALIVGMLLKSFAEGIQLKTRQAEIHQKQLQTELKQLKAQVQPHFLFNSLNNLYSDVYTTLPAAGDRIARLSDIMRYFMEETPKETVPLATEVNFIENYIELEKVRLHTPLDISMDVTADLSTRVPPMLLIPLVENVFKHGIQNNGVQNKVLIRLQQQDEHVHFLVQNTAAAPQTETLRKGTGLPNLKERLALLFKNNYRLDIRRIGDQFIAELQFPVP